MQLVINEIFGPTVQGEGPSLGTRATFLRLAMCNLKCSWCDTKYTWDWKGEFGKAYSRADEAHLREVDDVRHELLLMPSTPLLVITGGEPLLQERGLAQLMLDRDCGFQRIEIETNGTIVPKVTGNFPFVYFNVSPKLANSGNNLSKRLRYAALEHFSMNPRARFKFVVEHQQDLAEVDVLVDQLKIPPSKIWLMPEGTAIGQMIERAPWITAMATERGFNVTTRLHILTWGNRRGV